MNELVDIIRAIVVALQITDALMKVSSGVTLNRGRNHQT